MKQIIIITDSDSDYVETLANARLADLGDKVTDIQFIPTSTTGNWPKYSVMIVYEKPADSGD